jgi:hypothetical protein
MDWRASAKQLTESLLKKMAWESQCKPLLKSHNFPVAYSGDGEHRFRFYREHLNSTHWVHDIFNLSVHDGQF